MNAKNLFNVHSRINKTVKKLTDLGYSVDRSDALEGVPYLPIPENGIPMIRHFYNPEYESNSKTYSVEVIGVYSDYMNDLVNNDDSFYLKKVSLGYLGRCLEKTHKKSSFNSDVENVLLKIHKIKKFRLQFPGRTEICTGYDETAVFNDPFNYVPGMEPKDIDNGENCIEIVMMNFNKIPDINFEYHRYRMSSLMRVPGDVSTYFRYVSLNEKITNKKREYIEEMITNTALVIVCGENKKLREMCFNRKPEIKEILRNMNYFTYDPINYSVQSGIDVHALATSFTINRGEILPHFIGLTGVDNP